MENGEKPLRERIDKNIVIVVLKWIGGVKEKKSYLLS